MVDYFTDFQGTIYVQPNGPGTETFWLPCTDLDATDAPGGDVTRAFCRTSSGGWETAIEQQGAPSSSTFTLTTWLGKTRNWLQKKWRERCPLNVYVHHKECETPSHIFDDYETGEALQYGFPITKGGANQAKQRAEEGASATPVDESFDFSARPLPPRYWKLVHTPRTIAEDEPLRDVTFNSTIVCGGECGAYQPACNEGMITADAAAVAIADVWFTTDGAQTWVAAANQPFTTSEDVNSGVSVHISQGITRYIVMRGTTDAGNPAEVAYTNDRGATAWNPVNLGSTNGEYGMHSGGLFTLNHDQNYVWACTDQGNVFFSGDGAQTWIDQGANASNALYYIHFIDTRYGWTVGASQEILRTTDGGVHWAAPTALPGAGTDVFTCVATVTSQVAFVGGTTAATAGLLYRTANGGTSWVDYIGRLAVAGGLPEGTITHIGDVKFIDEFAGVVTGTFNDGSDDFVGTWRTVDGGWNWEFYYDAAAPLDGAVEKQGGNAIWPCDYNHAFSVGEVSSSAGTIGEFSAIGSV